MFLKLRRNEHPTAQRVAALPQEQRMYNTPLSSTARINSGSMKEPWRKEGSGSPAHNARIKPNINTNTAPAITAYSAIS